MSSKLNIVVITLHLSGNDAVDELAFSGKIDAVFSKGGPSIYRHVEQIRLKTVFHVKVRIIGHGTIIEQKTIFQCQRGNLTGRVIAIGAGNRPTVGQSYILEEPAVLEFSRAGGHDNSSGSIPAVCDKRTVFYGCSSCIDQIQCSGISSWTAAECLTGCVITEHCIGNTNRMIGGIDRCR